MPKKSDSVRGNKEHKEHSPMKDRAREPGKGGASRAGEDRPKKNNEMKPIRGNKNVLDDIGEPKRENDNMFGDIKKMSGGKKKSGCFPKLLMLLLSIVTGAAYFLLGS